MVESRPMPIKYVLPLLAFILAATGAAIFLAAKPDTGFSTQLASEQAIHKKIDEIVVRLTREHGSTPRAAELIEAEINKIGKGTRARRLGTGNVEVSIEGAEIPRTIALPAATRN